GCHAPPHKCQVHHVTHWIDGGRTAVDIMIMLCVTHHRMIHRAGWTVRMTDGWPEFIPPKWLDASQTPRRKPRPHEYTRVGPSGSAASGAATASAVPTPLSGH